MADDEVVSLRTGRGSMVAALVIGAVPFVITVSNTSSRSVNGVVTEFTYRDYVAIACGATALVLGVYALWCAIKSKTKSVLVGAIGGLALGAFQLAKGFGVFDTPTGASGYSESHASMSTTPPEPSAPPKPKAPPKPDPDACQDKDSCNAAAQQLDEAKDPKGAATARARACANYDDKAACLDAAERLQKDDPDKARAMLVKGCELDSAGACADLGIAYLTSDGVGKDAARGLKLEEQGCQLGSKIGCKNLAFMYDTGKDVRVDRKKAYEYARRSCELEGSVDISVADQIGIMCNYAASAVTAGKLVKKDLKKAAELRTAADTYNQAACSAGNESACKRLPSATPTPAEKKKK